jgi:hypothetical protein
MNDINKDEQQEGLTSLTNIQQFLRPNQTFTTIIDFVLLQKTIRKNPMNVYLWNKNKVFYIIYKPFEDWNYQKLQPAGPNRFPELGPVELKPHHQHPVALHLDYYSRLSASGHSHCHKALMQSCFSF